MSKSATIRARMEPDLKKEVEQIFKTLGLTATEAITLFYNMVKLDLKICFFFTHFVDKISKKKYKSN